MQSPTAAIIIIGNEILSGRTFDINTQYIAAKLEDHGIKLIEVRVIGDGQSMIIKTVNSLRNKYTYIFVTGGIGPTHDDITTDSIAKAFNLPIEQNQVAHERLSSRCRLLGREMNAAYAKMANLPKDCKLIDNPVSAAPGFIIENVFVMAGVPNIMQAMFDVILPNLKQGNKIHTKTIEVMLGESVIAGSLEDLQNKYLEVEIGSYPFTLNNKHGTNIVFKSIDAIKLKQAYEEFEIILLNSKST